MRCETGKFPIKIIQGDSYRRVYKFYDVDGNIIDNTNLATVYFTCPRLNYSTSLNYSTDDEGWVLYFTSDTTKEFAYCKADYDLTLYFTDRQISTQIYRSEFRVCEKKMLPVVEVGGEGEYVNIDDITTEVYTNIIVGNGGGIADHSILLNRDLPNQHPMSAITGLEEVLDGKADSGDIPTKTSDLTNDSNFVNQDYVADVAEGLQDQIDDIEAVISTQATPTNKLVSASEMGDAISAVEAKQLYATSSQGSFATKAQLLSATTFYNADGTVATPTKNDIAYVLADESHSGKSAKYVVADITVSGIVWGFVITFSDTTFSQAQMDAINSGVTQQKVSAYDSHITDKSNPHEVTYQQLSGTNPSYTKGETDTLLGGKLSDAPSDGKQYARKDGEWSEVASDGALIINYNSPQTTDYANAISAFDAGRAVLLKKDNIALPMTGYDATHCFFGGTVSAYLPAGYVLCVYAHIGTNGTNYFWYPYNSPVEAAGLYSEDAGNYFTSTNVMGQLQEIGAKLATYPSEVWQGGSY